MTTDKQNKLALVFALMAYSIFGFSFLFSKIALGVVSPFVLLAVRFSMAFLTLNLLMAFGVFRIRLKGKNVKRLLLLGIFQPILYFIFENFGMRLSTASFAGIMIAMVPMVSLILSGLILKEKVRLTQGLFVLLSIVGVFFTTAGQLDVDFQWGGFFLLMGAVFSAGLFNIFNRKLAREFGSFERTYVMFALGFVVFTGVALVENRGVPLMTVLEPMKDPVFWGSVTFLAVASSVGAFLMLNYAATHLSVVQATIFSNITTIVSILAGVLILKEDFGVFQLLGSVIIIISAYGVNRKPRNQRDGSFDYALGVEPALAVAEVVVVEGEEIV
ncbi:DMT family transporter [Alkalibacter rhizosphaerae]|uniref:DMT family transporter n=1 Tax=Alkalibacter rhizosphaerae TaxID=2815577 RepID=A0A974XG53_9FIRM|nr:DMT family transporter [Alkalibacter rhizosphaerae]QSX09252.1 DMT family transporter [Alkalibacter rhizosphaerae]